MTPVTFIGAVDAVSQHYDITPAGLQGLQSIQNTEPLQSVNGLQGINDGQEGGE